MLSHLKCGLLSEKLGHSLSPSLYKKLESYEYKLYEKSMDEALDFLRFGDYDVLNVTVPYKELAFSICDECSLLCKELKTPILLSKTELLESFMATILTLRASSVFLMTLMLLRQFASFLELEELQR